MDIWVAVVSAVALVMATLVTAHYARLGHLYKARYGDSKNLTDEDKQRLEAEIAAWRKGPFRPSAPGKVWQPIAISLIIGLVLAGVLLWVAWQRGPWSVTELPSTPAYLIYDFEREVPPEWSVDYGKVTLEISETQAFTGRRSLALDMQLAKRSDENTSGGAMIILTGRNLENKLIVTRLWMPHNAPSNLWAGFMLGDRNHLWQDGKSTRLSPGEWSTLVWSTQDCAEWQSPATLGLWFNLGETSSDTDRLEWQGRVFVDTVEILDFKPVHERDTDIEADRSARPSRSHLVKRIDFQYEASPTDHGWYLFLDNPTAEAEPTIDLVQDAHVGRALSISSAVSYGLEYIIDGSTANSAHVLRGSVKMGERAALYTKVRLIKKDDALSEFCWLRLRIGIGEPIRGEQEGECEWLVYVEPIMSQDGGWEQFEIDLAEVVARSMGKEGWELGAVETIRLRGNIGIRFLDLLEIVPTSE